MIIGFEKDKITMTKEDIISQVVEYVSSLPNDIETSTSDLLRKTCGFEIALDSNNGYLVGNMLFDFDEMFELDTEIRSAIRRAGLIVDDSKHAYCFQGLLFHCSYFVRKKKIFTNLIIRCRLFVRKIKYDIHIKSILR